MTHGDRWRAGPAVRPDAADGSSPGSAALYPPAADAHADPHAVLFELDPTAAGTVDHADSETAFGPGRPTRHSRHRIRRQRRRAAVAAALVAAVAVVLVTFVVVHFVGSGSDDWSGSGYGSVSVSVASGDTAGDIARALQHAGVVKTEQAFIDAADADPRSTGIQPGTYRLHRHMSAREALQLLLNPASRDTTHDTLVTEGATTLTVRAELEKVLGSSARPVLDRVLSHPELLTLPRNYNPAGGGRLTSLEGFLYPATYTFSRSEKPADAIQAMVTKFTAVDRGMNFAAQAASLHLTPYEALIIASIAQSEARFSQDMPKVVRTIMNRLRLGRPLQLDSTSSYACKLQAITHCLYDSVSSPYNTYRNSGLPPTPIDNPGADALNAAVHPASGDWLYFVTKDAAGHLFFTSDQQAFAKAAAVCSAHHWGCG